jgi:hypothetical protein
LREEVTTHQADLRKAIVGMEEAAHHTLDLRFFVESAEAYGQGVLRAFDACQSLRAGADHIGPSLRACKASLNRSINEQEHPEVEVFENLLKRAGVAPDLGEGWWEVLQSLRASYASLAGQMAATSAWTSLSAAPRPYDAVSTIAERIATFLREGRNVLQVSERRMRLSRMTRLEPHSVQVAVEAAEAAARTLAMVRARLESEGAGGGGAASSTVDAAFSEVDALLEVLRGDA